MFKHFSIPSSFSFIKKGRFSFLIKEEYKSLLLQQGIEDFKVFFKRNRQSSYYLKGRTLHPSIHLREQERMVIRQYSHGGLFRNFTRNLYLFGSRSFRELALTEAIRSCGILTNQPIVAVHRFIFWPIYQAYLLSLEILHSKDLAQYFQEIGSHPSRENLALKRKTIRSAGLLVRKFHRSGFFHADLQVKNILVSGDQLFIIDLDRSYRKKALTIRERLKNLLRLNRSIEKWKRVGLPITHTDRWRFFLSYAGEDETIQKAMKKAIRTYSVRHFLYRCGWALQKLAGS
jgi:tRNA A-37 threonylcarbamoyl transferase component Bud32